MMESVALTASHMIVDDDDDFVMVHPESDDDMGVDEDSYDNCDEELVERLSPVPSSMSASFCSEIKELESLMEEHGASIVSLEETNDESRDDSNSGTLTLQSNLGSAQPKEVEEKGDDDAKATDDAAKASESREEATATDPPTRSRVSNKKRRKKVKMLKKAAAAAAAATALAEMNNSSVPVPVQPRRQKTKGCSSGKPKKNSRVAPNIAVACATESLSQYRAEHGVKKDTHNYVGLL